MKPDELDALVDTIAERVRARINTERVGAVALPAAGHGAWYDESSLRAWLSQNVARIGSDGSTPSGRAELAARIDHTLLKPDATRADVVKLCDEARQHNFA